MLAGFIFLQIWVCLLFIFLCVCEWAVIFFYQIPCLSDPIFGNGQNKLVLLGPMLKNTGHGFAIFEHSENMAGNSNTLKP